ncbi:EamA family transporter [Commensalibacter communis]|uniref:EamA family transporter n=1 Tax=Commensalibacter communis TaxID=2972786 RepID=UPI0022FFC113|nr:DMT family transporter [Commensalibacter communis]CAI3937019.1 Threonine/homoserine efflux transporter RhtA (RhtA) [Commensalibacter communis]CAI3941116.1 Threonine/homoserine efflux transporter RhtA (RhtA) [Commensalibacter communis]
MSAKLQGIILVLLGTISYGLPASLIKLSKQDGITEANILFFQFFFGCLALGILYFISTKKIKTNETPLNSSAKRSLILSGTALALTNSFYFTSLEYVSVAIAAVMLMQSVWITSVLDFIFKKVVPNPIQIISIIVVLVGTIFTANLINTTMVISPFGLFLSFMSGVCYAVTIMVTNNLAPQASAVGRSFYISLGAFIVISLLWGWSINFTIIPLSLKWGMMIACFAIVLPLLLFAKGMPKITAGIGGVLSALELPAAIAFAYFILDEHITLLQFIGVILIFIAISSVNLVRKKSIEI